MITVSAEELRSLAPRKAKPSIVVGLAAHQSVLIGAGITTPLRVAHFWAQCAHESDGFHTMEEYASGAAYEGRKDLGNTHDGDGVRYKGRGPFQLTGRANYRKYGNILHVDLESNPSKAAEPGIALEVAAEYWKSHGCNALADKNDIRGITKKINGGFNGLEARRGYFNAAWKLWGDREDMPAPAKTMATSKIGNAAVATGATGVGTVYAAFSAGKDVVANAGDVRDTVANAGALLGFSGMQALAIGGVVLVLAGLAYIWYERRNKLVEEGI